MKDQFVIACLGDFSMQKAVMSHAAFLSRMLGKGIILLYVDDPRYKGISTESAEQRMLEIEAQHADLHPAHVAMKGNMREVVHALPKLLNGVVAVVGTDTHALRRTPTHPDSVLHDFADCAIAYLAVQDQLTRPESYLNVAYSVDFNRESKDKLLWASYFARFNKSRLHMLHYDYKDDRLRQLFSNNIQFMDKFFRTLNLGYEDHVLSGRAPLFPEGRVLEEAKALGCGLLITLTTDLRKRDVLEWFIGTQEQRIVRNPLLMPILFLNPRDDFYVLCD